MIFHNSPILYAHMKEPSARHKELSERSRLTWTATGHIDHFSVILIFIVSLLSAAALIIWSVVSQPDIGYITSWFPEVGTVLVILGGFGFAVTNSLAEEIIFRGILWEGISFLIGKGFLCIGVQALIFALWHYKGFPGGPAGSILVFLWGLLLGILRARTGDMHAPMIAHFFSDMVIFLLLFFKICY